MGFGNFMGSGVQCSAFIGCVSDSGSGNRPPPPRNGRGLLGGSGTAA